MGNFTIPHWEGEKSDPVNMPAQIAKMYHFGIARI
jgi:hypothetical protein